MIAAEPARSLQNPIFAVKMGLLLLVLTLTALFARPMRVDAGFWEANASRRATARVLAVSSLITWVGIVFAGRWIAYFQSL
jgi:hypothetical protein